MPVKLTAGIVRDGFRRFWRAGVSRKFVHLYLYPPAQRGLFHAPALMSLIQVYDLVDFQNAIDTWFPRDSLDIQIDDEALLKGVPL